MKKKDRDGPAVSLPDLCHHRWAIPALAALYRLGGGAKFVTLQHALGSGRDSLVRTLEGLVARGFVVHNPGYGHPMRPEYLLTAAGKRAAPACVRLCDKLRRHRIEDLALNKWSMPVVYALATAGGRFNALRLALPQVTPRALSQSLRDLEAAGLAVRKLVDDTPPRSEYALTARGRALFTALRELARTGPTAGTSEAGPGY